MISVGIVVYPGFQMLALAVSTVFEYANIIAGDRRYDVSVISEHGGQVPTSQHLLIATSPFAGTAFDTLIVTGNNEAAPASDALVAYLQASAPTSRRIASICTGAFILAQAGLLDGKRATTHWQYARQFRRAYPRVTMEEDRIFIIDGKIWTSAGMSAGVDLALALVEKDLGADVARLIARKLVVYHRRAGGQSQYSALLELDAKSDRVQTALAYAKEHLNGDLSVEKLADVAAISVRQFSRIFLDETGQSPAKAIEHLRVEAARLMMEGGRYSIDVIAGQTGFGDRERMRRAFLRAFGQPPQAMQRASRAQFSELTV